MGFLSLSYRLSPSPTMDWLHGCHSSPHRPIPPHNSRRVMHGKTSLLHYDLLLFRAGMYSSQIQDELIELAGEEFLKLRHSNSVDQISRTALQSMKRTFPELFLGETYLTRGTRRHTRRMSSRCAQWSISTHQDRVQRASRPNGSDAAIWDFGPTEIFEEAL